METLTNEVQGLFTDITGIIPPNFKHLQEYSMNLG